MNISRLGANVLAKSISAVSFAGFNNKNAQKPKFDTVELIDSRKVKLGDDTSKFAIAADSLSTSTSGHRAIYGTEMFNDELMEVFAMGVADYAKEQAAIKGKKRPVVMIGGDTRQATRESIPVIINKLQEANVDVYHIEEPVATPLLALMAEKNPEEIDISILMTASHNPWEYGGFNLVTSDGAIAPAPVTKKIAQNVKDTADKGFYYAIQPEDFKPVKKVDPYELYKQQIQDLDLIDIDAIKDSGIKIYYDSLSGTGQYVVPKMMKDFGIDITEIKTKAEDIEGPDPVEKNLALLKQEVLEDESELKIGLSNDGDSDRFGVMDSDGNFLTPNEVIFLTAYHLHKNKGKEGALVRSQVTTSLLDDYASANGLETVVTPVGFKFLAEEIINARENGSDAIVAGEESGGLTVAGHIPEKDGIIAILLMADLMATEKKPLKQIYNDIMEDMDLHFDSYSTAKKFDSDADKNKVMDRMETVYQNAVNKGETEFLPGFEIDVDRCQEHREKMIGYKGNSDGVKLFFTNGSQITVRKSGTEPKIRVYIEAKGDTDEKATKNCEILKTQVDEIFSV